MTSAEMEKLRVLISDSIAELQVSDIYLEEATQPIAPSVALGRLTRVVKKSHSARLGAVPETLICVPCAERKKN